MVKEFQGDHRWLSNFYPCTVVLDGVTYPSIENAYQAAKTTNQDERIAFRECKPGQAKRAGRSVTVRPDWDCIKLDVMAELTKQKYKHKNLRSMLLSTGEQYIQEGNRWGDTFWGVCLKTNKGENNLGRIIMMVREHIVMEAKC